MTGCHQTADSQSILDTFKALDAKLDSISIHGQNESLGAFVGKIVIDSTLMDAINARKKIESFITSAKVLLQNQPEGDSIFTNRFFLAKHNGEQLFSMIKSYQYRISTINMDGDTRHKINSIFSQLLNVPTSQSWSDSYFKNTPSVAALTMLNYFELNIKKVFILVNNGSK